jgi:hypothetical protein
MVDDRTIEQLVEEKRGDLEALVSALIKAANRGGGEDNITVVAFEVAEDDSGDAVEETHPMHTIEAGEAEFDDEDTLTEADRVPAVDTMVVSVDDIAAAYDAREETKPKRRGWVSRLLAILAVLVVLSAIAFAIAWGLMR